MRHLIGITAAVALGGSAMAADLAVKAPAPVGNWTSCFVGGNVGGGWSRNATNDFFTSGGAVISTTQVDGGGLLYGGQVGCDYQFWGRWVVGVEGKFDNGPIKGLNSLESPFVTAPGGTVTYPDTMNTKLPWIATATARLGYSFVPRTMIYVRGGAAFTKDEMTITSSATAAPLFVATDNRTGWTIGTGLEHKWWPNLTGFVQYDYVNLGKSSLSFTTPGGGPGGALNFTGQVQSLMVGLNLRLYGGGPISSSY
jgi:outer membrane immunogenic protein